MRRLLATLLLALSGLACDQPSTDPCLDFVGEPEQVTGIDAAIAVTYPDDHPSWAPAPERIDAMLFYVAVDEQDGACPVADMLDVVSHVALDAAEESPEATNVGCTVLDAETLGCCAWELPAGASEITGDTFVAWARDACSLPGSVVLEP